MQRKYILFGIGLGLGFSLIFLLRMAAEQLVVSGSLQVWQNNVYHPAFSGVTPEGNCYLTITNAFSGQTEVFLITKELNEQFPKTRRPVGKYGSLTFFGPGPADKEWTPSPR